MAGLRFGPGPVVGDTFNTNSSNPENAWVLAFCNGGGEARRMYVTQASTATIGLGHPVFIVSSAATVPVSGNVVVVEPFLTAANVTASNVGFLGQSCSGNAMAWVQCSGAGTVMVRGTGATTSISAGQPIVFNSTTGFVVSGAVWASQDLNLWARVAATGSVNGASVTTIGSLSTDTVTVEAFICRNRVPF